jgi:hypothetical protein
MIRPENGDSIWMNLEKCVVSQHWANIKYNN